MLTTGKGLTALLIGFGLMAALRITSASAAQIDLNTAPETSLTDLPGVSKKIAKKIVDNRPYATVNDLAKAGMKNAAILEKIAPLVIQPYSTPTPKVAHSDGETADDANWGRIHGRN